MQIHLLLSSSDVFDLCDFLLEQSVVDDKNGLAVLDFKANDMFYNTFDPANKKYIYNLNSTANYSRVVKTKKD